MIRFIPLFSLVILAAVLWSSCAPGQEGTPSSGQASASNDPLPSWTDGPTKQGILNFVARTTTPGDSAFIPASDRIAVFDNDGTLWSEQPAYFQLFFAIDRIREMAPIHPEWKKTEPFSSLLAGDMTAVLKGGEKHLARIVAASHTGIPVDTFEAIVRTWIDTAKHPVTRKRLIDLTYLPMLELLHFLRAKDYKTFIVSGGGIDFLRAWAEAVYGIPPYQVIGSAMKAGYTLREGRPVLTKLPELDFIDDKEGKVQGIYQHIGKRPVFAAGNSDGDVAMLQYVMSGSRYPRFGLVVHHTDSLREYAYDRNSAIGKLTEGLDMANQYGWKVVDMSRDWHQVYPPQ